MRQKNWRLVIVGIVLIILAVTFFFVMWAMALRSNDPVVLMQTVGQVCGILIGLSTVLILFGLIGRKV